jgi:hypothetical protein
MANIWLITQDWFDLIVVIVIATVAIIKLFAGLIVLLDVLLYKFYKLKWSIIWLHSLSGLFAVINILYLLIKKPELWNLRQFEGSFASFLWDYSPLKTIVFFIFCFFLALVILWIFIGEPFRIKFNKGEDFA